MKGIAFVISLIFCTTSVAFAEDMGKLRGFVKIVDYMPYICDQEPCIYPRTHVFNLSLITVKNMQDSSTLVLYTNSNGAFRTILPAGKYSISTPLGKRVVKVKSGKITRADFIPEAH